MRHGKTIYGRHTPLNISRIKSIKIIAKTSLFKYTKKFTTKKWKFSDKNSDIFHIFLILGGSNEDPQSMFLRGNKKK